MIRIDDPKLARLIRFLMGSRCVQHGQNGDVYVERFLHDDHAQATAFYHRVREQLRIAGADSTIQMRLIDQEVVLELHHRGLAIIPYEGQSVLCLAADPEELERVPLGNHQAIAARIERLACSACPTA